MVLDLYCTPDFHHHDSPHLVSTAFASDKELAAMRAELKVMLQKVKTLRDRIKEDAAILKEEKALNNYEAKFAKQRANKAAVLDKKKAAAALKGKSKKEAESSEDAMGQDPLLWTQCRRKFLIKNFFSTFCVFHVYCDRIRN